MIQEIIAKTNYKNFVPPLSERQIGWRCYVEKMPVEVCGTDQMRLGWLSAWRAEGYALTSQVWGEESQVTA